MIRLHSYLILATTSLVFAATASALPVLGGGGDDGDSPPGGGGSGGGNTDAVIQVPLDYPTIQAAIDAATNGDHILVSPGTYRNVGNNWWEPVIDTKGKALWIQADGDIFDPAPVIDGQNIRSCVVCSSGEGNDTIIQGFRIINGYATMGGGAYCLQSSPTFKYCGFEDNIAIDYGGGFYSEDGSPKLVNCTFTNNVATDGAGAHCDQGNPTYSNCVFDGNHATDDGGGLSAWESSPVLVGCTFKNNSAAPEDDGMGGGLCSLNSVTTLTDCVFRGNHAGSGWGGGASIHLASTDFPQSSVTLSNVVVCGNLPNQLTGNHADNGGNCIALTCLDTDSDGQPDCGAYGMDDFLFVPSEYATIEKAIDYAAPVATIEIAAGTYLPALSLDTLGKALAINGAIDNQGAPATVIDGQGMISVLRCASGEDATTSFTNLLITNGSGGFSAGGMENIHSTPSLTNCVFANNASVHYGAMKNTGSNPTLFNCTFTGNVGGEMGDGGGMFNVGESSPTLTDCTFSNNVLTYVHGMGAGMWNSIDCNPTLTNCTFTGNVIEGDGGRGAGMFNMGSPTLIGCTFSDNSFTGTGGTGGGIYSNETYGNPALTDTTVCGNSPVQIHGPWSDNGGNLVSDDCEFPAEGGNSPDINGDDVVNGEDMAYLLGAWGSNDIDADIDGDGIVNGSDLSILLGAWN